MAQKAKDSEPRRRRSAGSELDQAARERLKRDWALPMNERLARMHELCSQMTAIAGAARRR
ncbi:MAG: hypothetical protein WD844_01265 [Thermoleophilaceae bacterium]